MITKPAEYVRSLPTTEFETLVDSVLERFLADREEEVARLIGDGPWIESPGNEQARAARLTWEEENTTPMTIGIPKQMVKVLEGVSSFQNCSVQSIIIRWVHEGLMRLRQEMMDRQKTSHPA